MISEPPLIPHSVLFAADGTLGPAISPDGNHIAYIDKLDGVSNVFVRAIEEGDGGRALTSDKGRGVSTFAWVPNGRYVVYLQDVGGDENWQVHAVDVTDGTSRPLAALPEVKAHLLGVDTRQPDIVAVGLNERDPRWHDVWHINVVTGERTLVAENPGFTRWALDPRLQPRAGVRPADDGAEVVVRTTAAADSDWRTVLRVPSEDAFPLIFDVFPMWCSADGEHVYAVTSIESDTTRLIRVTASAGDWEPVAGHPGGDILTVEFDPDTGAPQFVIVPTDRDQQIVVDPTMEPVAEALRALHPGDWRILSRDGQDRRWTVEYITDQGSRAFYLFDRPTGEGRLLFHAQPELEDYKLAAMEPFSYEARDGLVIHGYLTFPPGQPRQGLPTVIAVHGGPPNRDFWGLKPLPQLLANRGYLVVQVNFRGSLGYGKAFLDAGNRQWARAMHTDVLDAIAYVIDQGWADRERIGMFGASYGGYETLVTVTHDPDVVRCAVAGTAPVNLVTLLRSVPPYWRAESEYFRRALGDPDRDEALLWERSPLRLADRIKVPLLLFYGDRDARVPVSEVHQLVEVLERNGIAHELHVLENEGHFLGGAMSQEHLDRYVFAMERFFATHLGGRAQPEAFSHAPQT